MSLRTYPEGNHIVAVKGMDLRDGSYELILHVINTEGYEKSCAVSFSVREVFPVLEVLNPAGGGVYPGRTIEMVFSTNAVVYYMLDDKNGVALSGDTLTVAEDGAYNLLFTAIHPVSGNVIRKSIPFTADSVSPEIQLNSPESKLYTHNEINIDYSVNKPDCTVSMSLDNKTMEVLWNLTPGAHTFSIQIKDKAGRAAEKQVDFQVAKLEITSPLEGEKLVSETYPCVVPFSYAQEGWFGVLTRALDDQKGRTITERPGELIPVKTSPGKHELYLRGRMNEFNVSRRTGFQIGRKNLTAGPGSIEYTYQGSGMKDKYEVSVSLNIKNNGDLDIDDPTVVRFDVISQLVRFRGELLE